MIYCIHDVNPCNRNVITLEIVWFAWDEEQVRIGHLGETLLVDFGEPRAEDRTRLAELLCRDVSTADGEDIDWQHVIRNSPESD